MEKEEKLGGGGAGASRSDRIVLSAAGGAGGAGTSYSGGAGGGGAYTNYFRHAYASAPSGTIGGYAASGENFNSQWVSAGRRSRNNRRSTCWSRWKQSDFLELGDYLLYMQSF